ncbi:MAG: BamA/TamA family outer membrane protein [Deinococcus-Thermus bacterium]|jgi:translocation and assembly module TamA|nr:BamA/TamA family outer membrane protein [Deinococcota bacterium]
MSRCLLAALGAGLAASQALALESVDVRAPGAEPALARLLQRASLSREALTEAEAADEAVSTGEALAAARGEYRQMTAALYSEGYYSGVVSVRVDGREAADLSPISPPARIDRIVVEVRPGPRFRFSEAEVAPLAPETDLPEGFARGETARSQVIREAGRAAVDGWRDVGHAKAALATRRIIADHRSRRLDARLGVDPGPRLTFGPLRISGNNRVRTERIRAIAGLPVGDVYDPEELDDAAERLRRTGAFSAVTLADAETVGPGGTLPIDATIQEEKRRRLGAGIEASSTEGLGLNAYWMHRNLLGGAENLRFEFDVSNIGASGEDNGIDYMLTGRFRRPATPIRDMDLIFGGEIRREEEPGFTAYTAQFGGGFSYIFSDALDVEVSAAYRASEVEDAFGKRDFQMLLLPSELTYDTRDDDLDPTRGLFLRAEAQPFAGISGIDGGARVTADARTYVGFGEDRRIVAAGRLQFGSLLGPDIDGAPPDFLFFAGGGGSVRGQPFQALGTGERNGQVIGGRSYLAASAELRAYVRGPFGVVGFVDAGYIGGEEVYDGSGEWIAGAGVGLRYDTGFGPIRVDVAAPVEGGPDDADPVQIYIGIGQAF